MVCRFTAGDQASLLYLIETVYGTTPSSGNSTSQFKLGLLTTSWARQDDRKRYRQYLPGSRSYDVNTSVDQGNDVAFSISGALRNNAEWADPLISGALGKNGSAVATTPLGGLPSFSTLMQMGSSISGNLAQVLFTGCKVNSLTLSADEPKAVLNVQAEIYAQYAELAKNGAVSKLRALTLNVPSDNVDTRPAAVQWNAGMKLGAADLYPSSWSLQIQNGLSRTMGTIRGADSKDHLATLCLGEGRRTITHTMTCWMHDYRQIQDQLDNEKLTQLDIVLGNGKTIRLSNGRYSLSLPEHVQDEHTVSMTTDWASAVIV